MKRILIITGGKFYDKFAARFLQENQFDEIIAADHGLDGAARIGVPVDVLLGDFDSADHDMLERLERTLHPTIVTHPPEKDQTDTELAITYAIEHGAQEITILGGTGSRLDHVMGTVHAMKIALDAEVDCVLIDPWNRIRMIDKGISIRRKEQYGEFISLIPFTEVVCNLNLSGMKYPLMDAFLPQGISLGISNEITAETAHITFKEGILLVIESTDREKYTI